MSIALNTSGGWRYLASRSINSHRMETIKGAKTLADAQSMGAKDRLIDWFFGGVKARAIGLLYQVLHPEYRPPLAGPADSSLPPQFERIQAFLELRKLARQDGQACFYMDFPDPEAEISQLQDVKAPLPAVTCRISNPLANSRNGGVMDEVLLEVELPLPTFEEGINEILTVPLSNSAAFFARDALLKRLDPANNPKHKMWSDVFKTGNQAKDELAKLTQHQKIEIAGVINQEFNGVPGFLELDSGDIAYPLGLDMVPIEQRFLQNIVQPSKVNDIVGWMSAYVRANDLWHKSGGPGDELLALHLADVEKGAVACKFTELEQQQLSLDVPGLHPQNATRMAPLGMTIEMGQAIQADAGKMSAYLKFCHQKCDYNDRLMCNFRARNGGEDSIVAEGSDHGHAAIQRLYSFFSDRNFSPSLSTRYQLAYATKLAGLDKVKNPAMFV